MSHDKNEMADLGFLDVSPDDTTMRSLGMAEALRDYADMIESGEIQSVLLVGIGATVEDHPPAVYSFASFKCRITAIGAAEYIKGRLSACED